MAEIFMVHVTIHQNIAAQIGKTVDVLNLLMATGYGYSSAGIPNPHDLGFRTTYPEPDLC